MPSETALSGSAHSCDGTPVTATTGPPSVLRWFPRAVDEDDGRGPVTNWHDYSTATRAALAALARGSCYFPGCRTPILTLVGGRPEVDVEMVPIRGSLRDRTSFADL